jgi:integrase/recombinase XerD
MGKTSSTSTALAPIEAAAIASPAAPSLPGAALERLPNLGAGADPYWRLVSAFLVGYPPHSSRAYFSDLGAWYAWCATADVHPLTARRHHVDVWVRHLSEQPQPATGRQGSPASIARRLSCLSQLYDYGIKGAELLEYSPVANVRRPKVSDDSSTVGLTAEELDRMNSDLQVIAHPRAQAPFLHTVQAPRDPSRKPETISQD